MKFKTLMFKEPVNNEEVIFARIYDNILYMAETPELYPETATVKKLIDFYKFENIDFSKLELVDIELTFTEPEM